MVRPTALRIARRIPVFLALTLYPAWWMYPLFANRPPRRLGTRLSDTIQLEVNADGFRRSWSTFLRYGSDFFPDGQSFVRLEWFSQFLPHVYTWISSLILLPTDVLHLWILIGWVASGVAIYWSLRMFDANVPSSLLAGLLVQLMPAFRWFAINHVNYMFIAVAVVPATFILRTSFRVKDHSTARVLMQAGSAHILLLFLDGYIGYFAVLLTIFALVLSSTSTGRSSKERIGGFAISILLFIALLLSGRIFTNINRGNATRTLRTYIDGVDSNVRTLVDPTPDIGFGNLSPYVGWPIIVLLMTGLVCARKSRLSIALGVLLATSTAYSLSVASWSWSFPLDILADFVPRMRFYDRYAVLNSTMIIAIACGTVLRRYSKNFSSALKLALVLTLVVVTVRLYQPESLRGEVDSSLEAGAIMAALAPNRDVVLRIGGPPLIAGVRFASFPNNWDELYALSRGNLHLRNIACATGVTHVLVHGTIDANWQGNQYMSAYGPREWVNFDDHRYFSPQATGWWDDRSDATSYDRRPLRLLQLRNCRQTRKPVNALAGPVEVVNDGVIVRQIRSDSFNNYNFAVSPEVVIEPRYGSDHRHSVLSWRFTLSLSDGFNLPVLSATVSHSGSFAVEYVTIWSGESQLVSFQTTYPHKVTIKTEPRAEASTYFAISNFEVATLPVDR